MDRNQKIALGCGGAGCLGLIVVAIAGGLIYYFVSRNPVRSRDYNFNVSTNRNTNSNDNSDLTTNSNSDSSNSSNRSSSSDSSMSDDDKHKLYQAALMVPDTELRRRVEIKLGLRDEDYTLGDNYERFVTDHIDWSLRNTDFTTSISTPEKARAYINEHID